ncbi:MAG TPA: hypothetical protein VJ044_14050 [Candidatus Hodarchaeales archaeon]|nr:hypothetical protein [Candidatus Hodarchaeales archaeon]
MKTITIFGALIVYAFLFGLSLGRFHLSVSVMFLTILYALTIWVTSYYPAKWVTKLFRKYS